MVALRVQVVLVYGFLEPIENPKFFKEYLDP